MSRLIALVLVGHAVMHVGAVACGPLFDSPTGPVAAIGVDVALIRTLSVVLGSVIVASCLLAAFASVGLVVPRNWWRPLVAVAAAASMVLLSGLFSPEALPGLAIDLVLLWVAARRVWTPEVHGATASARPH